MADLRMPDLNNVVIAGNLVKNPKLSHTMNGTPVSNFTIASNRRFKDSVGQTKEDVCFVGIVAWYKLAESCADNLGQGSAVLVTGELQSKQWQRDDGGYHNMVEIKAHRIQFLSKAELKLNDFNDYEDESSDQMHRNLNKWEIGSEEVSLKDEIPEESEERKVKFKFGLNNLDF